MELSRWPLVVHLVYTNIKVSRTPVSPIGNVPPVENELAYYRQHMGQAVAA